MQPPAPTEDPDPETVRPDLPREVVGFRLQRELGRGGMGVVYEARETVSGRVVALKVLARELSVSEEAFNRFQREARLAGAISDAHCVFVYGAHQVEGSPAISMELVGGETLEDRLRRDEPIPVDTAVGWAIEILDGLEAAHEVGVVHRDVKPSNCFLTADGHVKIGDFGLARTLERDVALTQSGAFLGSPLYASPEQVRGRPLDLRSDLYSAAATLYAMLTGTAPYAGGSVGEVLARILSESPPAPRTLRPEIPRALEKVVLKAMSRDPANRYKSYAAFRDALAPFTVDALHTARTPLRLVAMLIDSVPVGAQETVIMMLTSMSLVDPDRPWLYRSFAAMPALLLFPILYFTLFEGLLGATPGKWLFGQRVVAAHNGQPSLLRSLVRALVYYSVPVVSHAVMRSLPIENELVGTVAAAVIPIALTLSLFLTARSSNGWRGVHELVSGTRTTQRPSPFQRFRPATSSFSTPAVPVDDMPAEVGGYTIEGVLGHTPAGRLLRGRDPDLDRSVWVHERHDADGGGWPGVVHHDRTTRVRWLTRIEEAGRAYDVFEDPGGVALASLRASQRPAPWPLARRQLRTLTDELATRESEDPATRLAVEQVWIDRSWKVRVLDLPIADETPEPRTPVEVLSESAGLFLATRPGPDARLPTDLPVHAEPGVRRLLGRAQPFASAESARAELERWEDRPASVSTNLRAAQVALSAAFPLIGATMGLLGLLVAIVVIRPIGTGTALVEQLERAEIHAQSGDPDAQPPTGDLLRAHRILIAKSSMGDLGRMVTLELEGRQRELLDEAVAAFPDPTGEDVAWAEAQFAEAGLQIPGPREEWWEVLARGSALILGVTSGLWLGFGLLLSLLLRGGLSFRLTGIRLRARSGQLASRLRCVLRTLVAGTPVLLLAGATALVHGAEQFVLGLVLIAVAVLLAGGGMALSVLGSGVSLQDRVVGTRLVPR